MTHFSLLKIALIASAFPATGLLWTLLRSEDLGVTSANEHCCNTYSCADRAFYFRRLFELPSGGCLTRTIGPFSTSAHRRPNCLERTCGLLGRHRVEGPIFGAPVQSPARRLRTSFSSGRSVYTPQMIVDGDAQLVGSDEHEALRVIGSAAKVSKIPVSLSAPRLEGTNSIAVHVDVKPILSAVKPISGIVLIALADESDQSNVRRGENAGRVLKHVAVVRTLTQVGTVEGSSGFSKDVTVSTENANLQNLRIVALVQEGTAGRVLGELDPRGSRISFF